MKIEDIVRHPRVDYLAKDFDSQEGYRFKIDIANSQFIETGIYLHWKENRPVDIAIDLSCMSGCSEHCWFCAAAHKNNETLTPEQIVQQAKLAFDNINSVVTHFFDNAITKKITFSFEGIGEPSACYENIAQAINLLLEEYSDKYEIQFIISTILAQPKALVYWADQKIQLHSLQISLHGATDQVRKSVMGPNRNGITIEQIFNALQDFNKRCPETQIKINYLLIQGKNDSDQDRFNLINLLSNTNYYLKIAFLNETGPSKLHDLQRTPINQFKAFYEACKLEYPRTYVYGSIQQIGISCGQLASYAEEVSLHVETRHLIKEIYETLIDHNMTLFLGAGASSTVWNSTQLAEALYRNLGFTRPFEESNLDLAKIADIYEARNRRMDVHRTIEERLRSADYPAEFLDMTKFPWRAIYTTNYDEFVERAYIDAFKLGLTKRQCVPIRSTEDIPTPLSEHEVALIKLHGCVTQGVRQHGRIISGKDYLDGYTNDREYLFKLFEVDGLRSTMLFAGYSFRDQQLSQKLFDLRKAAETSGNAYAVMPRNEMTRDEERILQSKYRITLIPCTFKDLILELNRLRNSLVVLVSGSRKAKTGSGQKRVDFSTRIDEFCSILGQLFDQESIRLVTGATAKDKVGYLIGSAMQHKELVTTYIWQGADANNNEASGDEIKEMINRRYYGSRPQDIIDKTVRLCNAVIFVGGSGLALEEFHRANSAGKLIIPISLDDERYASRIIHSYFRLNLKKIETFDADIGYRNKKQGFGSLANFLTEERLDKLDLSNRHPTEVAMTVMDILRDYRLVNSDLSLTTVPKV